MRLIRFSCGLLPLLLAIFLYAGCATQKPLIFVSEVPPPKLDSIEDARQLLLRTYGAAHTVKASGEIDMKLLKEERWRPASFLLMIEKPDKVRLRAYRPFVPTLFEMISDGENCWLYIPSEKTAYLDEDCGVVHGGDEAVSVSADAIVAAVTVISNFSELFSMPASFHKENGFASLTFGGEGGTRNEIWIDRMNGLVTRQFFWGTDGEPLADITYEKNAVIEGTVIPSDINIRLIRFGTAIRLKVEEFQVDPELPSGAFEFSPPRGTKILSAGAEDLEPHK